MRAIVIAFLTTILHLNSCGRSNRALRGLSDKPVLSTRLQTETLTQIDFARHVKPILEERCVWCHDGKKADYNLTNRNEALKNQNIIPKEPEQSPLYLAAAGQHPELKAFDAEVKIASSDLLTLKNWISSGALWPKGPSGNLTAQ